MHGVFIVNITFPTTTVFPTVLLPLLYHHPQEPSHNLTVPHNTGLTYYPHIILSRLYCLPQHPHTTRNSPPIAILSPRALFPSPLHSSQYFSHHCHSHSTPPIVIMLPKAPLPLPYWHTQYCSHHTKPLPPPHCPLQNCSHSQTTPTTAFPLPHSPTLPPLVPYHYPQHPFPISPFLCNHFFNPLMATYRFLWY